MKVSVLTSLLKPPVRLLRRALGTDALLFENQRLSDQIVSLSNAVAAGCLGEPALRQTAAYLRAAEVVRLLCPMDVEHSRFTRVGRRHDGGYIMIDDINPESTPFAYSIGINDDVGWDKDIAGRGIDVFMYDHTITSLPEDHRRFHFQRIGVTGAQRSPMLKSLPEMIESNGHSESSRMLLKIDVEGCEWEAFAHCTVDTLSRFSQLVVEFHGLTNAVFGNSYALVLDVLSKLNSTHQSVHVHGNNHARALSWPGVVLPDLLEVTYASRDVYGARLATSSRYFPTLIDAPCKSQCFDIPLGDFGRQLLAAMKTNS